MKELPNNSKNDFSKAMLILLNVILMTITVLVTMWSSNETRVTQERLMLQNFCSTVDTMKQISVRYLSGELTDAKNWAAYIEHEHMSMDEALDYIRTVSDTSSSEAHIVDMDTFEAWSTNFVAGSNTIGIYQKYLAQSEGFTDEYILRMQKMFNGEKYVLGKYRSSESQKTYISVGLRVTLRQEDGTDRDYLLLRAIPIEIMKKLWLFPTSYPSAEIGLIDERGWYVIPSRSMRAGNFIEFVRDYNFADDYYGADELLLTQLAEQDSGLLQLKDSKEQDCYWYYSRLDEFEGLDILGYIPVSELSDSSDNLSIVLVVAGILLLAILDGAYILNINRQLRVTADIAKKASSAKTQFLSTMSHDIRTPLNAVLGMTELAQNHIDDTAYVQECLRKISLSGSHLLTLINDILEISRVESGRVSINPAPFDLNELIYELESITRSQAVGHGLQFDVQTSDLPAPYLVGDKLRLTQVYLNLLNNAVKYTPPGGSVQLAVHEEPLADNGVMLVADISDTGVGMSTEFQKTMYDSFTRVSDSRIDKIQGTGLGLAIVRRMVNLMDGTIDCTSIEGEGTHFTVRIPLTAAAEASVQPASADVKPSGSDLANTHVLIAEDNELNWEIISEMLGGYGISCDHAENGRECVDMLNAAAPDTYDLVLMDVQMPILNGREATCELRAGKRPDLRTIPIIAMTADAFAEDIQMCIDAGMDAHVAKPIEIDKVLAAIRLALSRKSSADGCQC